MTALKLLCPQLSADIYLRSKGNEASPIIIGRASAKVDENGFGIGIKVLQTILRLQPIALRATALHGVNRCYEQ